ncbi:MAG: STAS domain-containing protein [Candidatus Riflebacteria bacterium]|nr:STAS domain-containing protein [Candidatus Riflebacteria bacterium]
MIEFEIVGEKEKVVVKLSGELGLPSIAPIRKELQKLTKEHPRELTFDLSKTLSVDSNGIELLISTKKSFVLFGGKVKISGASDEIKGLFEVLGMTKDFIFEENPIKSN